jgi:hypothetical protein
MAAEGVFLKDVNWVAGSSPTNGPSAAAGLASGDAELGGVEVGLAQQELEPDRGQHEGMAGERGAQPDRVWEWT